MDALLFAAGLVCFGVSLLLIGILVEKYRDHLRWKRIKKMMDELGDDRTTHTDYGAMQYRNAAPFKEDRHELN